MARAAQHEQSPDAPPSPHEPDFNAGTQASASQNQVSKSARLFDSLARWSAWGGLFIFVGMLGANASGLRYNSTTSMPEGIYSETEIDERAVAPGELVMFCLPEPVAAFGLERGYLLKGRCPGDAAPLGKAVVATEGDTVSVTAQGVSVNGEAIPATEPLTQDSRGRPLQAALGEVVLLEGEVFVMSNYHGKSFDSRYFGPVQTASIRGRIAQVITWGNDWEDDLRKIFTKRNAPGRS